MTCSDVLSSIPSTVIVQLPLFTTILTKGNSSKNQLLISLVQLTPEQTQGLGAPTLTPCSLSYPHLRILELYATAVGVY